jgi:hypothetical protein
MDKSFGHIGYSQNDNKKDTNQSGRIQINLSKNALWSKVPIKKIAFFCNESKTSSHSMFIDHSHLSVNRV